MPTFSDLLSSGSDKKEAIGGERDSLINQIRIIENFERTKIKNCEVNLENNYIASYSYPSMPHSPHLFFETWTNLKLMFT